MKPPCSLTVLGTPVEPFLGAAPVTPDQSTCRRKPGLRGQLGGVAVDTGLRNEEGRSSAMSTRLRETLAGE